MVSFLAAMSADRFELRALTVAVALAVGLCFAGIGSRGIWSPDEPTGASVGRTMHESGDMVVPRLNGEPFVEKPPLYWWVQVALFELAGRSPATARLPSSLFSALTLLVAFAMGRHLGETRTGLLAAAVLGSTILFMEQAQRVVVDPALAFFVALVHFGFLLLADPVSPRARRAALLLIAVATPLAFLSKGFVALGLGLGPPLLWMIATRRSRALRDLVSLAALGAPLFVLAVAPWAWALWRDGGRAVFEEGLVNNTYGRFLPGRRVVLYGHSQPFWYYLELVPVFLLPWSLALPALIRERWLSRGGRAAGHDARGLLAAICGVGLLLLSLAASKRELYLLPLLPAFSAWVAWWLAIRLAEPTAEGERRPWERPTWRALLGVAAALPVVVWGALLVVRFAPPAPLDLAPLRDGLSPLRLTIYGTIALAGCATVLRRLRRGRREPVHAAWIAIPCLLLELAVQTELKGRIDPVKNLHGLTDAIARELPGDDPVPAFLPPKYSREVVFGIVGFDLGRRTRTIATAEELRSFFTANPESAVVFRVKDASGLPADLRAHLRFVYDESGRTASPYALARWEGPGTD